MTPVRPQNRLFDAVVVEYERMEPNGTDTWNPLTRDRELQHRLVLYQQLCLALRTWGDDPEQLHVLDIGCGNGRSSRMYLDFGVLPEQIAGIDLRLAALKAARRLHPAIRYVAVSGGSFPFATASFNWISLCTVLSSIGGVGARQGLISEIQRVLVPGGQLFYFDRLTAHRFAGGDELQLHSLFAGMEPLHNQLVCIHDSAGEFPMDSQEPPSHQACLLQKHFKSAMSG